MRRVGSLLLLFLLMMAASVMALTPVLLLYFLAQKAMVKGIVLSGMKG